ncbi:MAG TPA: transposase [Anaerolineae bacterium]
MSHRYRVFSDTHYAYFVTCTIVDWLPVFEHEAYRRIILDSLAYIRERKQTQLNAFVIMPTHLHVVLWPQEGINLADVLRDFKRFTSRSISKEASRRGDRRFLSIFAAARQQGRAQDTSQYQVWQEGSHPEAVYTLDFARQKINYIHANPVRAGLTTVPEDWPYSSARTYLLGEETYPPTDMLPA